MGSFSKFLAGLLATALAVVISPVLPASSSALPSYESRISVVFTTTETGSGNNRTLTFTAEITDSAGQLVLPLGSVSGSQVRLAGIAVRNCPEPSPQIRSAGWNHPQGCAADSGSVSNPSFSGSTLVISRSYSGAQLLSFEADRSSFPALVVYIGLDQGDDINRMLVFGSSGPSAAQALEATAYFDPGVSFSGPLISGASGRTQPTETAGTLRFTGKRLNQVTSATIGGIEVTVTPAGRSAVELEFDALPAGKHDVVLKTKAGSVTTLRGFVTVN